jgi:hypothetical protein
MSGRLLTIGELARRAGVATSALRYWEELGLPLTSGRAAPATASSVSAISCLQTGQRVTI